MKQKHFIDTHKGATGIVTLALIAHYHAWDNIAAFIYLALHGTYGVLWILKSRFFGDKQWEQKTGLPYGLFIWFGLSLYWVSPWLIASGRVPVAPAWYLGLCIVIYTMGIFLHFVSDMQKHLSLKFRPGVLITDGLWSRVRNPNYLGELLVYLGFSLIARHPAPLCALALIIGVIWIPNMIKKDRSLSRYPEFAAYRTRSSLIIPYLI